MADVSGEEIFYLQQVSTKRWHQDIPFRLDRISLGLVEKGLLELDLTRYLARWYLTAEGEKVVQSHPPPDAQRRP